MPMHGCHSPDRSAQWAKLAMIGARGFREWGDEGWLRPRHGGPRRRMFASGELRLVLLKLIAEQSRHGYELIKAIEQLTGGAYAPSPGVVYPTLSLMTDEGAIEEAAGEGPRKAFAATDQGRAELVERAEEAERLVARLASLAGGRPGRSPQLGRAMGNLANVLRHRAGAELPDDLLERIVDVIDDAAKRIERL